MKALGPAWWGGLLLGLFVGMFATALLVETETVPVGYVKFLRGGGALGAALTAVVGGWVMRRAQARAGAASNGGSG